MPFGIETPSGLQRARRRQKELPGLYWSRDKFAVQAIPEQPSRIQEKPALLPPDDFRGFFSMLPGWIWNLRASSCVRNREDFLLAAWDQRCQFPAFKC